MIDNHFKQFDCKEVEITFDGNIVIKGSLRIINDSVKLLHNLPALIPIKSHSISGNSFYTHVSTIFDAKSGGITFPISEIKTIDRAITVISEESGCEGEQETVLDAVLEAKKIDITKEITLCLLSKMDYPNNMSNETYSRIIDNAVYITNTIIDKLKHNK